MDKKKVAIVLAATILPGGLIALGLWKAYELLKKKKEVKDDKADNPK
jgi:chromate transport protein ChrA